MRSEKGEEGGPLRPAEVVDTHQHLWDLSRLRLPWLAAVPALNRDHGMADYVAAVVGTGITKSVYMEVDVAPEQRLAEADIAAGLCAGGGTPMRAATLAAAPGERGFRETVERYRQLSCARGVRQVLHVPERKAGHCLQKAYVRDVTALGKAGLRFVICIRPGELGDAARLAAACPETRFVLDHCGNADPQVVAGRRAADRSELFWHTADGWRRDIDAVAKQPNVVCKISGIVARAPEGWRAEDLAPTIDHCLDAFGPERVVFGSDWPVCTLRAPLAAWVQALREVIAGRSEEAQQALLGGNAERFYAV